MKSGIHPNYKQVPVTCSCGNTYTVGSATKEQEIRVETAVGDLPIRVMPEEARSKMEAKHQLNLNDTAPDTPQVVDGKLTYTYEGTESKKLFGFFPVKLN